MNLQKIRLVLAELLALDDETLATLSALLSDTTNPMPSQFDRLSSPDAKAALQLFPVLKRISAVLEG